MEAFFILMENMERVAAFSQKIAAIKQQLARDVVGQQEIIDNDYDLSINKYKKTVYEAVEYPSTTELMTDLYELQMKISEGMEVLEGLLHG